MYTVRVGIKVSEVRPNKLHERTVVEGADPHFTINMALKHVSDIVQKIPEQFARDKCARRETIGRHDCVRVSGPEISHGKQTVGIDVIYTEGCFESSTVVATFVEKVKNLLHKANAASHIAAVSA